MRTGAANLFVWASARSTRAAPTASVGPHGRSACFRPCSVSRGFPLRHRKQHKLAERQFDHVLQRVEPVIACIPAAELVNKNPPGGVGTAAPFDYGAMN